MTRTERLQQHFTKDMKLIEIGASYNPLIPKAEGWNTTVIDHADQTELVEKYRGMEIATDKIEPVDFIWRDGPLIDAIPTELHGTFDGFFASHVGEHMPDLIGFFLAAATLLNPASGVLVLALPDKRLCFDFFRPLTTTGDLLNAKGRTRHPLGTLYDQTAYMTQRGGVIGWSKGGPVVPFHLMHGFEAAQGVLHQQTNGYTDSHAWKFTPASFELLVTELNLLREIPWAIEELVSADGVEFYATLRRRDLDLADVDTRRLQLLTEIVMETKEQIAELEVSDPPPVRPVRSISAIIPLYNGGKFIEESLRSVLAQTVLPKEIIVVDDGSSDNGPDLVRAMIANYPLIRLLSKPNGGQSSARNFGVQHSTGDLVALLDQDDIWYSTHLEKLFAPFADTSSGQELGWVYSDLDEIDTDGLMICHNFLSSLPTPHPKRDIFVCLREDMFVLPSASLISRKAFDEVGGFDEMLSGYEDDDFFMRVFRAGYGNIFLTEALSKWRIYPDSSSYSYRMRRSRAVYARKLLRTYVDDPRRARYIRRDLILPRFYAQAIAEYRDALISGDRPRIAETHAELKFIVDQIPAKKRLMGQMLTFIHSRRLAQVAFSARPLLQPILRRML